MKKLCLVLMLVALAPALSAQQEESTSEGWVEVGPGLSERTLPSGEVEYRLSGDAGARLLLDGLLVQIEALPEDGSRLRAAARLQERLDAPVDAAPFLGNYLLGLPATRNFECCTSSDCAANEICSSRQCIAQPPVCDPTCSGRRCSNDGNCSNGDCPLGFCARGRCECVF